MKKMMAMLLASVMAAGTFTTTAFAYTGDDVQKNTPVSTAAQETDAAESTNAGKNGKYRQHRNRPGHAGSAGWL